MNLAIINCLHGNEGYGLEVSKRLPTIPSFIGNEKALKENKRFIDVDLNRCFPGKQDGNHEEKLASYLKEKIKDFDYIIDIHSSSNNCPLFGIITKPNYEKIELAKKLGLKKLVIMPETIASGKALIDYVKCGISLEVGPHNRKENVNEVLEVINNLIEDKNYNNDLEIFEVFDIINKQEYKDNLENFVEVNDFTPVLVNEDAYGDVLCLAAKKVHNFYKEDNVNLNMKKESFKVTPWEVEGKVDYEKLVKEFGISKLDKPLLDRIGKIAGELHPMLRRKIFFAHRDLKEILDEYDKGNKFFIYTGCGPSGPIHLGHLGTWLFTKWLQDKFDVELWFQFTDDEKFLFKDKTYEEIQKWTHENMLDIIALGFDPKKTHFIVDTKHANLLYPEAIKIAKKITFSTIKGAFGFDNSRNIGEIFYTSMQAAPVIVPSVLKGRKIPCLIPLAVDQDPHFRVARDVYPKIGHPKPSLIHSVFLPPLTGVNGKMSSSKEGVAILTTDDSKTVAKKINKYAFSGGQPTIEEHRKKGGNPEIDVSFQYLKHIFEEDDKKLAQIEKDYKSGKLLSGELKAILIKKISEFLTQHQKKRKLAEKQIDKFLFKN